MENSCEQKQEPDRTWAKLKVIDLQLGYKLSFVNGLFAERKIEYSL